jgi:tetratricopeptide (TPR) repeat protein
MAGGEPPPASQGPDASVAAPGETAAAALAPEVPAAPKPPPVDPKLAAYQDAMYLVGSIWRAVGEESRAALAFSSSGRRADQVEAVKILKRTGDWREEATVLESQKRPRDAARIYEQHGAQADAARLFDAGGDLKSALRCALAGKDMDGARRLVKALAPAESQPILEKAGAWELLMEHYVGTGDFDNVARLYERARQFDQAALAWERAGKLSNARKAYERSRDSKGSARVRDLEVDKLIARGDRLGAAVLLLGAGQRERAVETLVALPAPKAFRFLQKAKLDAEAIELAKKEVALAEGANKPSDKARWLEMLGDVSAAAEAWEKAERRDKALALYEQAGNWQRAAELAEGLSQHDKAVELFHRAGDKVNAARVEALPKVAPPAAKVEPDPEPAEPPQ